MKVIYSTDKKYAPICGTSIQSLLSNNTNNKIEIVIIIDNAEEEKEKFLSIKKNYDNASILFIDMNEIIEKCKRLSLPKFKGGYSTWARLFISDYIEAERVLYIDCDTLILGDIKPLFEMSIGNNIIAAVADILNSKANLLISLKEDNIYFNAGILLVDLKAWNNNNISEKLVKAVNEIDIEKTATESDQELLNFVLHDKKCILSPRYNMTSLYRYASYKKIIYMTDSAIYDVSEIEDSKNNPVIYHFAGNRKRRPWYKGNYCTKNENNLWDYYLSKTMWKKYYKEEIHDSFLKRIINKIYNKYFPWMMLYFQKKRCLMKLIKR